MAADHDLKTNVSNSPDAPIPDRSVSPWPQAEEFLAAADSYERVASAMCTFGDPIEFSRSQPLVRLLRAAAQMAQQQEQQKPALLAYMEAETTPERDVAYLRLYAEKILNQTERFWEIPNTRAATVRDIATRFEATIQEIARLKGELVEAQGVKDDLTKGLCEDVDAAIARAEAAEATITAQAQEIETLKARQYEYLTLAECREKSHRDLAQRGETPNELQVKFREGFWDRLLAEYAVVDALVEQGTIAAWVGDGVGCVAQMIEAQVKRAEAAEAARAHLEHEIQRLEQEAQARYEQARADYLRVWQEEHPEESDYEEGAMDGYGHLLAFIEQLRAERDNPSPAARDAERRENA